MVNISDGNSEIGAHVGSILVSFDLFKASDLVAPGSVFLKVGSDLG